MGDRLVLQDTMGDRLVLQVSGIPTSLYYKMVRDQLFIHFLRRGNGGDGKVGVRYPTEEEGVAYLTFSQEEVANRVLSRRHQLELEGYTYPLEVSRPQCQRTQVSKPLAMVLSLGDVSAGAVGGSGYFPDDFSQRKSKDTSTDIDDATHLNFLPSPFKKTSANKDRTPDRNIPLASNGKLSSHMAITSTQYGDDRSEPRQHDDSYFSTGYKNRLSYIKPPLTHKGRPVPGSVGSSQRKPKDTSSDDSTSIKKHPRSKLAANLNFYPGPPEKILADEDRRTGRNSPLASNGKTADVLGLATHTTFASTQFREDLPGSKQPMDTFAADSSSSQSKPKGTIVDEFTSNPKHPNRTDGGRSDFNPEQPKNTSTDELNLKPKHSKGTIKDSTKFSSGQPKNTSTDELNSNTQHSKSTIGDVSKFNSGQPKNTFTDELSSNPKHSKVTIEDSTKFSSGQPKNTSTDELNSNPKHSKSTIGDDTKFNSGQPKNTSADELNSNPKLPKSTIGDIRGINYGQSKNTSADELNSNTKHFKRTKEDSTKLNSGQSKNTSREELNQNTKLPKSTIGDVSKFNSGQPKNTFTDELNSNPKVTIEDSTKFSSGQPKNTSREELNQNTKLPKSTIGDGANFERGKPQNSSPDELNLNPRIPENLTANSSNHSSLTAAGRPSSGSPAFNSLAASNPQSHLDQSPLSTDFLVDPAVHTYVRVFLKDTIKGILGQSDVEMKTEIGEGFNRVILTAKSPHLSQHFYKAAREMSDIFMKCQRFLRVQTIDLSNISADVTKELQLYLFSCDIWSSPNNKRLQMIGPSTDISEFMEKWTSAGGDFGRFVHLQAGISPGSSRPPAVGMDNVHQSTSHDHNRTPEVHTQRGRSSHRSEESGARGGSRGPDTNSRNKTAPNAPSK